MENFDFFIPAYLSCYYDVQASKQDLHLYLKKGPLISGYGTPFRPWVLLRSLQTKGMSDAEITGHCKKAIAKYISDVLVNLDPDHPVV